MSRVLKKETIGLRIKKARIKQNITIKELCKSTEIPEELLSTYESGRTSPSVIEIAKIAIVLNVTTDYILGRTNDLYIVNRSI